MSTQIGEVSINLRLSMAKFANDVQTGSTAVQQASDQMGDAVTEGTGKSREALRLLSEDIGVSLPRGLQSFIAGLPGVSTALNSAFAGVAIVAAIELVSQIIAKIEEFKQHAKDVQDALSTAGTAGADSLRKLQEQNLELIKQFDELAGDKIGALRTALQQVNDARLDGLKGQLDAVGKEVDGLLAKMRESSTFNLLHILWGSTDPNTGIAQVQSFFTQIQSNLDRLDKSGNVSGYGATLATALKEAQGAATGLSEQAPVVRQAWAAVASQLQLLQSQFELTNEKAKQLALNTNVAAANAQVDKLADGVKATGEAWLEMQAKVAQPSTDPTAQIQKDLDSAIASIQKFGNTAVGVWSAFDIAAAKASATSRAFDNELTQLLAVVNQLPDAMRKISNPTISVPQLDPTVVQNYTSLQRELQDVAKGGEAADEATQKVIDAQETLKQKIKEAQAELVILFSQGRITAAQYVKGLQQADAELLTHTKDWGKLGDQIGKTMAEFAEGSQSWIKSLENVGVEIAELILKMTLLKNLQNDSSFAGQLANGILGGLTGGGREDGGPVLANVPYMVGERRTPELFVPKTPGTIVPISQIRSSGGNGHTTNIHMEVNTPDADSFGKSQGQLLSDAYRNARVASAQNRGR